MRTGCVTQKYSSLGGGGLGRPAGRSQEPLIKDNEIRQRYISLPPSGDNQDLVGFSGIHSAIQTTLLITTMSRFKIISPISFLINNKPFRRQRSRAVPSANSEPEPDETHLPVTQELWSFPRVNIAKLGAIFWCFLLLGSNDSSYGVSARFPHVPMTSFSTDLMTAPGSHPACSSIHGCFELALRYAHVFS